MKTFSGVKTGIITFSLMVAALMWAPVVDAAPKDKPTDTVGKSDLNKDGAVNYDDLVIFSSDYLSENVETVDWCAFYQAVGMGDPVYGRKAKFYNKHFSALLSFTNNHFSCDRSDLNHDRAVNLDDLKIFSFHFLEMDWETVEWCVFHQATAVGTQFNGKPSSYYQTYFRTLLGFITDYYSCDNHQDLLLVVNTPKSLVRGVAATDSSGNYYFSDTRMGSVFIYNSSLILIGELKNLAKPLGVAIDSNGYLLVGNDGRNNIEVYDPADGTFLISFGDGMVKMPSSITIGPEGKIYVTDSRSHNIHVFDPAYISIGTIGSHGEGEAELNFPTDSVIISQVVDGAQMNQLYVADQGNQRIQIYDLEGNYWDTMFAPPSPEAPVYDNNGNRCRWFNPPPECTAAAAADFIRLQALAVDSQNRLHSLDIFEAKVSILDSVSGKQLGTYGGYGKGAGLLKAPIDLLLIDGNTALVTDKGSNKVEVFAIP